jgi:hypothetical protein
LFSAQGVVFSEANNMPEALRYYELAVKCNPNYVEALSNIGMHSPAQAALPFDATMIASSLLQV